MKSVGIIEDFITGGLFGVTVFGFASIMSGALNQQVISTLHGINLKIKIELRIYEENSTFILWYADDVQHAGS